MYITCLKYKITEVNHINLQKSHSNNNTILFVYRAFVSCIVRLFRVSCVRFVYRAFVSCILRSFRISCVFRVVRVKRSFVFRWFRLRFVHSVSLYDTGSVVHCMFICMVVISKVDSVHCYNTRER